MTCGCGKALPASNRSGRCRSCASRIAHAEGRLTVSMRPMPDDFAEYSHLSADQIAAHYRAGKAVANRWLAEAGVVKSRIRNPAPADLADVAPGLSFRALAAHYRTTVDIARAWVIRAGINRGCVTPAARTQYAARRSKRLPGPPETPASVIRDYSPVGQAADYLRRYGPVIRCRKDGTYAEKGDHWRRGSSVLTADEIIQRAERQGWRAAA